MKPDTRFFAAVLALCGGLSLAVAVMWQFSHPVFTGTYFHIESVVTGNEGVKVKTETLPYVLVDWPLLPGLLLTPPICGLAVVALVLLRRVKISLPKTLRVLSLLVGSATAAFFVWPAAAWYGHFVVDGPAEGLDVPASLPTYGSGNSNGWLGQYILPFYQKDVWLITAFFGATCVLLLVSRLDGRSVGAAMQSILLKLVLPVLITTSCVILLFDYPQLGIQVTHSLGQILVVKSSTSPPTVAEMSPIVFTNADELLGSVLILFLLCELKFRSLSVN